MKTMQDYILEQPEILNKLVDVKNIDEIKKLLLQNNIVGETPVDKLVMVASGTSYNAAVAARYYISMPVDVFYPYEFNMYTDIEQYHQNTLFVFISQSGESIETYRALDKVKQQFRTLSVTESSDSSIARSADVNILFGCGSETVIYRTKGFTASMITLVILGKLIANDPSVSFLSQVIPQKRILFDFIQYSISWFTSHTATLIDASAVFFVGCGKNRIIAYEAALKAIETIRIPAMPYEIEEFVHGPQNAINDKTPIVIIENDDMTEKAWSLFVALKKLNKKAFLITGKDHADYVDSILKRPFCQMDEIFVICALQQFCYTTSQCLDVDLTQRGFPELGNYIKKTF